MSVNDNRKECVDIRIDEDDPKDTYNQWLSLGLAEAEVLAKRLTCFALPLNIRRVYNVCRVIIVSRSRLAITAAVAECETLILLHRPTMSEMLSGP